MPTDLASLNLATKDLAAPTLYALGGLSNPIFLQTASPGGIAGTAAGFHVCMLFRPLAMANGNNFISRLAAAQGWGLRQFSATTFAFQCANGVGTLVTSAAFTLTGFTDKWIAAVGVHTGTQLQLWVNGAQVGADVAITGFTAQSNRTYAGAAGAATPFFDLAGCGGGPGVPTAANIRDWFANVKAARRVFSVVGTADHLWPAKQTAIAPTDTVGTDHFSLGGAGHTLVAVNYPVFGW